MVERSLQEIRTSLQRLSSEGVVVGSLSPWVPKYLGSSCVGQGRSLYLDIIFVFKRRLPVFTVITVPTRHFVCPVFVCLFCVLVTSPLPRLFGRSSNYSPWIRPPRPHNAHLCVLGSLRTVMNANRLFCQLLAGSVHACILLPWKGMYVCVTRTWEICICFEHMPGRSPPSVVLSSVVLLSVVEGKMECVFVCVCVFFLSMTCHGGEAC